MASSSVWDSFYGVDDAKLAALRAKKPWMADPNYIKRVHVSPSAVIRMMSHGQDGVEKGIKSNGKPVEVMGLLLGHPNPEDSHEVIISDAQPLPIEGFETRVVADDDKVLNYMIALSDMNEHTTKDVFCGWYHTHPFEVDVNSHCFLSGTDVSTQLQWQRSEDPHGNPWISIVIDPLRSLAKGSPEFMAFRVYPPEYNAPANKVPDGTIVVDDKARIEKWGACWNRYYKLESKYYMSDLAKETLKVLKENFLWSNVFTSSSLSDPDVIKRDVERLIDMNASLGSADGSSVCKLLGCGLAGHQNQLQELLKCRVSGREAHESLRNTAELASSIALDHCVAVTTHLVKQAAFDRAPVMTNSDVSM